MALGEYVSVSSQSDSQRAVIERKRRDLAERPRDMLAELTGAYRRQGLTEETSRRVAEELTAQNALQAHLSVDLHADEDEIVKPGHAAFASAVSFTLGAILPLLAILLPPEAWRIPVTFLAVLLSLGITGAVGAHLGGASRSRAALRVLIGGAVALAFTFIVGHLLGAAGVG